MPHIDLLELPHFADIPLGEVVFLIDAMAPRMLRPGEYALRAGEPVPALLITSAGTLSVTEPGTSGMAHTLPAPCALPVRAFFARAPSPLEARAIETVSLFVLSYETFMQLLLARHPAVAPFLLNLLRMPGTLQHGRSVG